MLRKALLFLMLTAGLVLVIVAGVLNHRDRVREAEAARNAKITLVKDDVPTDSPNIDESLRGKTAPDFTLTNLDGKKVSLADFKGHPMVLNFWATYCDFCQVEMPWLQQLGQKYAAQGFQVVGVDYDSEVGRTKIADAAQKLGVTYPILLSNEKIENAYLADNNVLPISFWLDRNGKVVNVTAGISGNEDQTKKTLEAQIQQAIAAN